ncbi:hypothetical protein ANN_20183 [Periplaneta americana]|uniref:Uncharacterized protein n=1 Tax=Periplaneta americana TaxID=6978 RepID=A0ABQ8SCJ2_PERAM|nr:hypothetical protein ANN_20183 [Periplaneta americana]
MVYLTTLANAEVISASPVCRNFIPQEFFYMSFAAAFAAQATSFYIFVRSALHTYSMTCGNNVRLVSGNISREQCSVDEIGDRELAFGELKPRIRHRLPNIRLMVGENPGKNPTRIELTHIYFKTLTKFRCKNIRLRTFSIIIQQVHCLRMLQHWRMEYSAGTLFSDMRMEYSAENRKHRLLPPPRLEFDDTGVKHKSLY